jgi:hypothetical protein
MKPSQTNIFSWIWANTDSITKWIQVAALVVAGYWTYTRFIRVDAPALETVARVEMKDPFFTAHDDSCRVKIGVVVLNEGHTSFEVGRTDSRLAKSCSTTDSRKPRLL